MKPFNDFLRSSTPC